MPSNETKRQHYVPKTYMKHFCEQSGGNYIIRALPIESPSEENIQEINITNICLQKDLYTLTGDTEEQRQLIEKFYSDEIESKYNQIYELLTDPDKNTITDVERDLIITTVITMLYRTTKWISLHNSFMDRVLENIYLLCQQTGKDYFMFEEEKVSISGKTLEQLKKENKVEARQGQVLTQLQTAFKLINLRKTRDGIFISKLDDDNCEFITSDNPIIYWNIQEVRALPFDPTNIIKLPLDSKHLLFLMPYSDQETKHMLIRNTVRGTIAKTEKLTSNFGQFKNAERFVLGTESGLKGYLETKGISETPLTTEENEELKSFKDIVKKGSELGLF